MEANANTYALYNKSTTNLGVQTGLGIDWKPNSKPINIFANTSYSKEYERLHLGKFDEITHNYNSFQSELGVKYKKHAISLYHDCINHLTNKTKNFKHFGIKYKYKF